MCMRKSQEARSHIAAYERNAISGFPLCAWDRSKTCSGRHRDELRAMLNYLDNSSSIGPHSDYTHEESASTVPE